MNSKMRNILFGIFFLIILGYKALIHEEPWAIGFTQVGALFLFLFIAYIVTLRFREVQTLWIQYFNSPGSPINLAVFRIIFYGFLFFSTDLKEVIWFSNFPKDLQFAPMGMGWLLPHLPINVTLATGAGYLFKLFCLMSMLGLRTRFSSLVSAVLGFYIIGIPQFYGNVAHSHLAFWFMMIFAFSRAGDALSIDAVLRGFKKADEGDVSSVQPSVSYTLPIRFFWLLMGICYFFPGLWKLWSAGSAYLLGDNLKFHMYYDWMGFDGWLPLVRVDQFPWLCRLASAGVIFFEMSFVFLIFFPNLRYFVVIQGLLFHNMTWLFMNINFLGLQLCYLSFLNWEKLFTLGGIKLFPDHLTVLYDGSCSFCRRAVTFMKTFDILGRIIYFDLHDPQIRPLIESTKLKTDELMADMHALVDSRIVKGFEAYQAIALRIPLLWPLFPFLFIGFVRSIGNNIYRHIADHRSCKLLPKQTSTLAQATSNVPLIIVASILIIANCFYGFIKKGSGWPFACYPTFSEIAWDRFMTIECQVIFQDGASKVIRIQSLKVYTGSYRIAGLMAKLVNIKDPIIRDKKFRALWKVLSDINPDLKKGVKAQFYFLENYTDPSKKYLNPIKRTMSFELDLNG